MVQIFVNGDEQKVSAGTTLAKLLEARQLSGKRFAIEVNEEIVPRSYLNEYRLKQGDRVEIVQAIGGG
ncbi:MAG: sulfur carrier protein ThiS [Gammaproteobacteria bacterium]